MPNWAMSNWETGRPLTLLESLGFSKAKFTFPQLTPQLPNVSAESQHPIQTGGGPGGGGGGPVTGGPTPKGPVKQYARKLMAQHSWTGASEWAAFVKIVVAESGWNPKIKNPSSGAFGIAQAYNHGQGSATQGTLSNMYGGYGLSDKQAKAANSGNPYWQLVWMMNYIDQTYGDPIAAWKYHQAHNSY